MADDRPAEHPIPDVRPGRDSGDDPNLKKNPGDGDAKLDVELDDSFPASDPPSSKDPTSSADRGGGSEEEADRAR